VRRGGAPSTVIYGGIALVVIAAIIGGAWYIWGRDITRSNTKQAAAAPPTTAPAATSTPRPALSPVTATATPVPVLPSPRVPVRPSPAAQARPGATNLAEARTLLKSGDFDAAAQGFAATVKAAPASSASVQILVACSPETVQKAVQNAGSPELFIVPVNYKGRDCYRLCWGLYESSSRAASAVRSLPEYFRKGATPRVVGASEIVR
jgi:septal ring-binding cell division protein DamX